MRYPAYVFHKSLYITALALRWSIGLLFRVIAEFLAKYFLDSVCTFIQPHI
jgi:hypothetical protein